MNSTAPNPSPKAPPPPEGDTLYAVRQKVYVRAVTGLFANWRWALVWFTQIVFYGLPWLQWNDRQAVLFHLTERKFYIFGWVFWPQDVFFLAILLIISAYALFFFTAIAGRLWCGYACPQTVYTEIFMWIEEKIEGDRNKRMKLDKAPMSPRKLGIKAAKYGAWGAVALWTGFTFVGYFSPMSELLASVATLGFGPWEMFWILFYGAFTYLFAGVMREQVCKYMCPYARFQAVMFDPDTLVITYDEGRGEPRGARRKGVDSATAGKGDCVDCGICVQVCPTGIDIRNGLQYECIGCAACIDACDQVMDKVGYPRGLIRYSTENAIKRGWGTKEIIGHVFRPRTLVYGTVLIAICVAFVWGLATRDPLRVDIIRDRASLGREVAGGMIENVYRLQVMNMTEVPRNFVFDVKGINGIQIAGDHRVAVEAAATQAVTLQVLVPYDAGKPGANEIVFEIHPEDDPSLKLFEKTTFLFPR
ncbi:cytochrome c oxidase accessory protein CcoG [Azoarcus communis]|uniref:Cytochrome c oxidase accessory protein CcoG n=1 Tax=Parazoarcus communis SWub3 = DSM 12120 TaxID=1121029 RepID=A0A323VAE6_9RHOO|nr:cytochrome c oxidase accessory protein CcoG [Parazoarcus communis]NMG47219.1 cytochrome c oxidase accessory protein CcoG [Parazoarcus communis]NMG71796.1 cytochrome c oxidase accessory protein CcoG [Parazoarcus communis SWub3 = DSM 12120]PZA17238.1 cytochrome c oxidase accessory protein CcoG [Azoarcus communis] [Parazoarcus communis SWub3 = DSM 12120]